MHELRMELHSQDPKIKVDAVQKDGWQRRFHVAYGRLEWGTLNPLKSF